LFGAKEIEEERYHFLVLFEILDLGFVWDLEVGVWDFNIAEENSACD